MKIGLSGRYLSAFLVLFAIIVLIALFATGPIRTHIGDIFIVMLIHCFVRAFVRNDLEWLPLYIFAFAVLIEIGQYFKLAERLGLADVALARIVIGTTFDPMDIAMYFVGCILLYAAEKLFTRLP